MKKILLIILLLLFPFFGALSSNLLYGPWVHNVSENGFSILWVTAEPSLDFVELAPDNGSAFDGCERQRIYETRYGRRVISRYHCVTLSSLEQGTGYRYRIVGKAVKDYSNPYRIEYGTERVISGKSVHCVRTLDSKAQVCRFSMLNDIHADDSLYKALSSGIDTENTDFIVLNGDIVSKAQSIDTVVCHTFGPVSRWTGSIPLVFARGNHEGRGMDSDKVKSLFPTSTGEFYYSFRQGPAAFIVLDAGEDKPDNHCEYGGTADYDTYRLQELEWIKQELGKSEFQSAPVKVCIIHIPPLGYKSGWYSQRWITEHFAPVLEKAGVDVVLSAHFHKWKMSPAGKDGKNVPVIVNSSDQRMDVEIKDGLIAVKTFDSEGKLCHEWKNKK